MRIADFSYRKAPLELGMLKGNQFIITLRYVFGTSAGHTLIIKGRNVQIESAGALENAMVTMKHGGFINYYGEPPHAALVANSRTYRFQECKDLELLRFQPI